MNRTFRVVWSDVHHGYVVAPESAGGVGKKSRSAVMASALMALLVGSGAVTSAELPAGGQVVAGSGTLVTAGSNLTINQATHKLAIDWQSFNIGQGKTVEFVQPSASAVALNRVLGTDVSVIQGALKANGQVFLVNPNGVLFTPTAQVNVGGIVASTLNIKTDDFMAGKYRFEGATSNAIVNQGNITASHGGTVALIAAKITNNGQINAERGNVLMGAGSKVRLDLGGPVKIEVEEGVLDALIEQGGGVQADGGLVYLTAKAVGQLSTTVINHTGITEARTLATGEQGQIYLMGGMEKDRIVVGGKLDATALSSGAGGFVETSSGHVKFAEDLHVKAGHWLIDPADIKVNASMATALEGQLAAGSASVQSTGTASGNGDIFIESPITWSSGHTLTFSAYRNIEINATLDAIGGSGGKVVLEYGRGASAAGNTAKYTFGTDAKINLKPGSNFSALLGSDGVLTNFTVLASGTTPFTNNSLNNSSGKWAIGSDIDFSAVGEKAGGFVGQNASGFVLEGLGHTLSNISIAPTWSYQGFFGHNLGTIRNLSVSNLSFAVNTRQSLGFVGYNRPGGVIENIKVSGTTSLSCQIYCGSIVGWNTGGVVRNFSVLGSITFDSGVTTGGGIVGMNSDSGLITAGQNDAAISFGNSTNEVKFGGIVGLNGAAITGVTFSGSLSSPSARTTAYESNDGIGGIAGHSNGTLSSSVFLGTISLGNGARRVGGIVGEHYSGSINDSTNFGTVTVGNNSAYIGGIAGKSTQGTASMSSVTFRGGVAAGTGSTYVGGLVGNNNGSVASSNASGTVSIGTTAATLLKGSSPLFLGKLFGNSGVEATNTFYQTPITVSTSPLSVKYGEIPSYSLTLISGTLNEGDSLNSILTGSPSCVGCVNVGTYSNKVTQNTLALSGSNYYLTWQNGSLTITPRPITVVADNKTKTYGAADPALTWQINSDSLVNGDTLAGVLSRSPGETVAGGPYAITQGTLAATANYDLTFTPGALTIGKADLAVTGLSASNKTYDGTTSASLSGTAAVSAFGSDVVSVAGTGIGTFTAKDVGTGKAVTVTGYSLMGTDAGNYRIVQPTGLTADITKAPLTVAADDKSRAYGAANPALTASITGFVNGENLASSGVSGAAALSTTALTSTSVGTADIVAALGTLAASNYDFNFTNGTLTITKAPLTVAADAQTKRRGANDPALSFRITSGALVGNDALTGELSRIAGEERGQYEITRGSLSNSNYDINFIGDFLTVTGAPPSTLGESSAVSIAQTMPTDLVNEYGRPPSASTLAGLRVEQTTEFPSTQAPAAGRSLILVEQPSSAPQASSAETSGGQTNRSSSTVFNPSGAGRDALGFMRVGVVNGGVNIDLSKKATN